MTSMPGRMEALREGDECRCRAAGGTGARDFGD